MIRTFFIGIYLLSSSIFALEKIKEISLEEAPLTSMIRVLCQDNELNIVPSMKARQTKVNIFLKNIDPIIALEEICSSHNLWLKKDPVKNIYRIYSLDEYKKSVLKFSEEVKVYDLKYPNSKSISETIFELFPSRVIYFESDQEDLEEEIDEIENKLEKLLIFEEQSLNSNTTQNNNSSRNRDDDDDDDDNNSNNSSEPRKIQLPEQNTVEKLDLTPELIHKINTAESIEEIRKIISSQDILKNARIFVASIPNKNQLVIRTGDLEALAKIDKLITKLDKPDPMVLLEMKILAVTLDDGFESAFDFNFNDGTSSFSIAPNLVTGSGALTYSYIDDKFNTSLSILEKESKLRTLATPVILTANREVSKFFNGNQSVPILTGFENDAEIVTNDNTTIVTVPTPNYETRDIGTTLKVSPTINADRTVQLQISSIESEIDLNSANVLIANGDTFLSVAVDTERRRSFTGTVLATDRKMIAVGGIIKESETEAVTGVPILKDIPLIKYAFSDTQKVKLREEIILLIKPYIIYSEEDHKNLSKDLLKRVSKHPNATKQKDELIKQEEIDEKAKKTQEKE